DLEKLRDDLKKSTSSQFAEEMRQMRNDARQLAQKEQDISRKIDEMANGPKKTLTDNGERKQTSEQLDKQKKDLETLVENMRRTSEQSEATEPILSRQLYDTLRQTSQEDSGKTLAQSKEWLNRGLFKQAGQLEDKARQNIERIK